MYIVEYENKSLYMLVPIRKILPYTYRFHHTSMGPHTGIVIFPTPYQYQ